MRKNQCVVAVLKEKAKKKYPDFWEEVRWNKKKEKLLILIKEKTSQEEIEISI